MKNEEIENSILVKIKNFENMIYSNKSIFDLTKEEFCYFYKNEMLCSEFDKLFFYRGRVWKKEYILKLLIEKYSELIQDIEANAINKDIIFILVDNGLYTSFEMIDKAMTLCREYQRRRLVRLCSFKKLKEIIENDTDAYVRKEAYIRLGPIESFSQAINDKSCDIRELGVAWAPYEHPELSKLKDDISIRVISPLVKKINVENLPYMLGNRNFIKNNHIRQLIENRLDKENEKNG